ncbi:hypothetical protein [Pantoea stewartii]|uniref:hypothetical protein n=1 Tax=Pantoea stewartii TaxID=66269 RepID=UPI00197EA639|nr:hypothetical protein [Pantoea stewartii]
MKINFSKVCLFWGGMDALYVIRFIWLNIEQGRIPFFDDIISFNQIYSAYGGGSWVVLVFILSMALNLSIILSAIFLLIKWNNVSFFIFLQTPFRLLFITPSISFFPLLLTYLDVNNVVFIVILLFISELIKILSFVLTKENKKEGGSHVE